MKSLPGKKKSIFINITVHLVTVFSFIILLGCSIYYFSTRSYFVEEAIRSNEQILQQAVSTYEIFLDSTIQASMVYMEQESTDDAIDAQENLHAYENRIYERLADISRLNDFIYSIYYFDRKPESIYVSSGLSFDSVDFYDREFISTLVFSKNYYILPARQLPTLTSGTKDVIPIVINLPLNSTNYICTYVINLDANRLFNHLIKNSSFDSRRIFKIVDFKGMILASSENADNVFQTLEEFSPPISFDAGYSSRLADLHDKKQLVSYYTSQKYEWHYICYIDSELIFSNIVRPLKVILAIALISLIISFLLAIFISKEFSRPVKDIMSVLGVDSAKSRSQNEYDIIKDHLNRYLIENKQFKETIDSNKAALKKQLFYSLVAQNIYTLPEIEEKLAYFNIQLTNTCIVLIISIDSIDTYNKEFCVSDKILLEFALENIACELLNKYGFGFFTSIESGKFALALTLPEDTLEKDAEQKASAVAYEIKQTIKSLFKFTITIGIGRVKNSLELLYSSFKEAMDALSFKESIGSDEIILYSEVMVASSVTLEYPSHIESTLTKYLLMGDPEKADDALHDLFQQFIGLKIVNPLNLHIFAVRFLNTLVKLIMELGIDETDLVFENQNFSFIMGSLLEANSCDECIRIFSLILRGLGNVIIERRSAATNQHVQMMTNYIDEHFNQTLSLDSIADYTKLNRCYAGRIFKQYTNMSIVDYVNQVRINKAAELLGQTDLNVGDIAESVGFNNANYFIKIFKKIMGKTPGQYKEQIQGNNN